MVAAGGLPSVPLQDRFGQLVCGRWSDSLGNAITVSFSSESEHKLTAVVAPCADIEQHPAAISRALKIRRSEEGRWRCGSSFLEWADEHKQRVVWITEDGRRSVWSRTEAEADQSAEVAKTVLVAFPWLIAKVPEQDHTKDDVPSDILHDGARIAALLDIRQMIGHAREAQERLTHILMDHDLHPGRGDYLVPGADSPLWETMNVSEALRLSITDRIRRIPHEATTHNITWNGVVEQDAAYSKSLEVLVGRHRIDLRNKLRDVETLEARWALAPKDKRKPLEIARLLALYSVFDNPMSKYRSGMHLGLDPELRSHCDYELFASPLNAVVPNGNFCSKWPHIEWRFGSLGSYPSVLTVLPTNAVVCVNPPFTELYLGDVMARLGELKLRFRLRLAVPVQDASWRKKLVKALPSAKLLTTYYDATNQTSAEIHTPTLLWEDPRCPVLRYSQEMLEKHGKIHGPLGCELGHQAAP